LAAEFSAIKVGK